MSAQGQIDRIKGNVADAYNAAQEKGASLPSQLNSDNLPVAIQSIPSGDYAERDLSNVENRDFYVKGVVSGLGQVIPEIQPMIEVYVSAYNAATKTITLSDKKPTNRVSVPISVNTSGTLVYVEYIYPNDGQISALSRWKLVLYFESLETNRDYEFSVRQWAYRGENLPDLIGNDLYVNRFAVTNPRIEIPLENNILPTSLDRVTGDKMVIELYITKSSGSPDTVNIISDNGIHDSKLVRNGGDIGSNNVVDFNGVDTKTQSQRNRQYEEALRNIGGGSGGGSGLKDISGWTGDFAIDERLNIPLTEQVSIGDNLMFVFSSTVLSELNIDIQVPVFGVIYDEEGVPVDLDFEKLIGMGMVNTPAAMSAPPPVFVVNINEENKDIYLEGYTRLGYAIYYVYSGGKIFMGITANNVVFKISKIFKL